MRYLLQKSQCKEIPARCEYLYDIFHLYCFPQNEIDGFIPLVPMGTAEPSILFIIGHQDKVGEFLRKNIGLVMEETIIVISCCPQTFKIFKSYGKALYTSKTENSFSYTYTGSHYGFDFDITESELDFYNSSEKDIVLRISSTFQLL